MRRKLSSRDIEYVNGKISEICELLGLENRGDDQNIGWEAFMDVYRSRPGDFLGNGIAGWEAATDKIYARLDTERKKANNIRYKQRSLDEPVSPDTDTPRTELLPHPHGDFQNSVCFWDYLKALRSSRKDAGTLAWELALGSTVEEARDFLCWERPRAERALCEIRSAMMEYLSI